MHAAECAGEIFDKPFKRQSQCGAAADQHIIMAGPHRRLPRQPHHLAKPPPHAIALDGIADLLGDRKPHSHRSILAPIQRLQHKTADGSPRAGRGGQEVCALPEAFHRRRGGPRLS
jgi:hypothetical protein